MAEESIAIACNMCGLPAQVFLTTVDEGIATDMAFFTSHAPAEFQSVMPKTPDELVSQLRSKLALLDQSGPDTLLNAKIRAELEQVIDDIEAGKKGLNDLL